MAERQTKRLGRPTKAPTPGKRVALGLKVTAEIKQRIDEEARKTGRTQSQQAELMIERSIAQDQRLDDVFGSSELFGLLRAVGTAMDAAGKTAGFMATRSPEGARGWIDHPYAYDQAVQAAAQVLDALRPQGEIELPNVRPPAHFPKPPGYIGPDGHEVTEEEFYRVMQEATAKVGTRNTDALLGQVRTEQAETMRANLGRLADRLNKERKK